MGNPYIVITTERSSYKCHAYSIKAGRVYFNSRAVNLANVIKITLKDSSIAYENPKVQVVAKPRATMHHCSTLKGAVKCKATTKKLSNAQKPKRPSSLPDVIEI